MKKYLYVTPGGYVRSETTLRSKDAPPDLVGLQAVEVPLTQVVSPAPDATSEYHLDSSSWVDVRSLAQKRLAAWARIKLSRDAVEFGTFVYNAMVFDGDINAQRRLAGYISVSKSALAASVAFSADFTLANNTLVTLSAADFVGVEIAKVQAVAAAFAQASTLRGQINAATTPAALDAIVWTTL